MFAGWISSATLAWGFAGLALLILSFVSRDVRWLARRAFQLLESLAYGRTDPDFPFPLPLSRTTQQAADSRQEAIKNYFRRIPNLPSIYERARRVTAASDVKLDLNSRSPSIWIGVGIEEDEKETFFEFVEAPPAFADYHKADPRPLVGWEELRAELVRLNFEQRENKPESLILARVVDAAILADRRFEWDYDREIRLEAAHPNGRPIHKEFRFESAPFFDRVLLEWRPTNWLLALFFPRRMCVVIEAQRAYAKFFKHMLRDDRRWLGAGIEFRLPSARPARHLPVNGDSFGGVPKVCLAKRIRSPGFVGSQLLVTIVDVAAQQAGEATVLLTADSAVNIGCPSALPLINVKPFGVTNVPPAALINLPLSLPCRAELDREQCAGGKALARRVTPRASSPVSEQYDSGRSMRAQRSRVVHRIVRQIGAHYSRAHNRVYRFPSLEVQQQRGFFSSKSESLVPGECLLDRAGKKVSAICTDNDSFERGRSAVVSASLLVEFFEFLLLSKAPAGYDEARGNQAPSQPNGSSITIATY